MNILLISAMFPPIQTGTSFYTKNLATALHKRGHSVRVVTVRNLDKDDESYPFEVVRLSAIHIPLKNYFKHLRFCSMLPGSYIHVFRTVKSFKPDCILLVNHYLDIAFPAVFLSLVRHIPLFCSVGTQLQSLNPVRDKLLNILERIICGLMIFPFCKRIIAWDTEIVRYLKAIHGESIAKKTTVIPYGVNGDIETYLSHSHDYSKVTQILGVGSIIEQRNYIFLIRVFAELLKTFPDLQLKIIGHIYYSEPLKIVEELGIGKSVIFTGELHHDKVLEEMKQSAVYWMMFSGKYTALGTATIEAMFLGIPIISNASADLLGKPLLIDNGNYIYTDGFSLKRTVESLERILRDKTFREIVGLNGRKMVMEYFNWGKISEQIESILNQGINISHTKP